MTVTDANDPAPDAAAMSESALAEAARQVADNPDVKRALQAVVDLAMAKLQLLRRQRDAGPGGRWCRDVGDVVRPDRKRRRSAVRL